MKQYYIYNTLQYLLTVLSQIKIKYYLYLLLKVPASLFVCEYSLLQKETDMCKSLVGCFYTVLGYSNTWLQVVEVGRCTTLSISMILSTLLWAKYAHKLQ